MFRVYNKVSYIAKHALIYALCLCMTIGWTQASAQLGGIGKSISGGANTVGQGITNTANTVGQGATNTANTVAQGTTNTANTVAQGSENLANETASFFGKKKSSEAAPPLGSTAESTGSTSTPSAADSSMYTIPGLDSSIIARYLVAGADQSLIILNDVTGTLSNISTLAGRTSPYAYVTQSLVDYFTRGMFSIALILFSYTTIMGTIYTADEGEVMGRKFQTFFVLFRSLIAITLYFPLQSGYSILQTLVSTIVITSVMVANVAWYTVVTIMVTMFSGTFGNSLMPYIGDEDQIIQQATQAATNSVDSTVTAKTTLYLIASGTSQLASQAIYMGQLAQMICVYENYDQGNNSDGISNAYNAINDSIFCSGDDCPFSNPSENISLTLPKPSRTTNDCGTVKFTVTNNYQSYAGAVIQPALSQLNGLARMYYESAVSTSNKQVTDTVAKTIANELYSMTSGSLVSMITSYMVQNPDQLTTSQADIIKNLTKGGWAMAANNYFYYAYTYWNNLDTNTQSPNYDSYIYVQPVRSQSENFSFCPSASSSTSTNASISVMNAMCNSLITSGNVGKSAQCATTPTASGCPGASSSTETYSGSMQQCALNINNCKNINQYLIANQEEGGQTVVKPKDFIKVFYKGFSTQISDMDSVKSFAQIEAMTKLCNVPFATSSLNSCEDEGSFLTPETGTEALLPAAIAAGAVLSLLPRYAWLAIVSPFVAFYGGIAWYQNYTDLYDLVSDPTKLYPDTLAFSVQSFTYLTVKAWFDTFDTSRNYLFVFPVQTFSAFGFRVLLQTVAFVFNVGTATFAANMSMTFGYFFRQVLIDSAIAVTQYYGTFTWRYGWYWLQANIFVIFPSPTLPLIWVDYIQLAKDTGIYAPLPVWWTIFILFIPIPIGLMIGLAIIPFGALSLLVSLAGTIAEIFNPAQILLQLNSFIISRYNPLYLAIATPIISFSTLFAFFLPLYPLVVYTLTIITWVTQYIETLLAMPIILLGMANPEGHSPLLGKAEKLIMLLAVLFVRPITIVMGFVAANIVASISVFIFCHVIIPMLDMQIGQWAAGYALMTVSGAGGVTPVFDSGEVTIQAVMTVVALIMFSMVLYYLLLNAFSLIYKLPNGIANWIGLSMMTNAQEEEIMMQLSGEINNITGSLTEASTSIATTQGDASSPGGGLDPNQSYSKGKSAYKEDMESGEARRESQGNAKHNRGES